MQTAPAPLSPQTPAAWPDRLQLDPPARGVLAAAINRGLRQNRIAVVGMTPSPGGVRFELETLARDPGWLEVGWPEGRPPTGPDDFELSAEVGVFDDAPALGGRLARSIRARIEDMWDDGYAPIDRRGPSAPRAGVPLR